MKPVSSSVTQEAVSMVTVSAMEWPTVPMAQMKQIVVSQCFSSNKVSYK